MTLPFERLLIGRTLAGRYQVEEVVGRGGMSVVFRAVDGTLGREVALKVVALPAAPEAEQALLRERFRREAGSAASISRHPNVVQVYDYGTDPELGLDFIVMELLQGRDLRQRLEEDGVPPLGEGVRIVAEAARGVAAGHEAGLLHRDVKPANVFLLGPGGEDVRVLDFGIAKPLGAEGDDGTLTHAGQAPHSPAYASPEQLDPDATLTPASDVYQLGLVAFETLTGEKPFSEADRDRIRAGADVPPPATDRWRALPAPLREVVARALSRRPEHRHPDAASFADALLAAEAQASPVFVPPVPSVDPDEETRLAAPLSAPRAPARSHAWGPARMTAAGAGVLVLLLLLWATLRPGRESGVAAGAPAAGDSTSARDSVFLALQGEAGGAPPAGAAEGASRGDATAENEVRASVHELNQSWVEGQISRHVGHYASRVDYYNSKRLPRSGVRRDRTRDLRRYAVMRRIDVGDIRLQWLAPDRIRALVQKSWDFRGEDQSRTGSGLQEYIFKRDDDDGHWYVVSEQLLTQTETRAPAAD